MKIGLKKILPSAGVLAMLMAGPALAQQSTAPAADDGSEEIVVTGTSIRGVAPIGNQVVTMDAEQIKQSGATSTALVLAHIPQLSDFGGSPAVFGGNNFQLAVNRPTLRNLGSGVASTAATLFLMDGHRLPGSGVLQTFPDPDIVPPSLIQRVEVVPDGGSSIYGSDAVAGVVNFITRSDYDGIQFDARHGFGDGFDSDDDALTIGKTWEGGSAYIAYSYSHRDPIFGGDRDYVRDIDWVTGNGTENRCDTPNFAQRISNPPAVFGPASALGGGPAVTCDRARQADLFSGDERSSVLGGFSQSLGANVDFDVKAWYTQRDVDSNTGPQRGEVLVQPGSPFSQTHTAVERVDFSFRPARATTGSTNHLETWGFAPELKWDIGHDWQFRALATYGFSRTNTELPVLLQADLDQAVAAGNLDPYHIADPAHIGTVNNILNRREWRGLGQDEITQVRGVFDGPVLSLPGGDIHAALGVERFNENFSTFSDGTNNLLSQAGRNECLFDIANSLSSFNGCTAAVGTNPPFTPAKASRDVDAMFAEFSIPIIGDSNELPFVHSLDLSLSVRHDDYSDFGGVTTKRYGFTYEPVEWVKVAGHWGDSFQAPGLADIARTGNTFLSLPLIPNIVLVAPNDRGVITTSAYDFFAVQGTGNDLKPQNAEAWDLSFDITPPILNNNLTFGATFWNIDYALRIGSSLTFIGNPSVYQNFPSKLIHTNTGLVEQDPATNLYNQCSVASATCVNLFDVARTLYPSQAAQLTTLQGNGKPLYAVYDFRNVNTGGDRREGLDVRVNYTDTTAWGTWYANLNGTHFIHYLIAPDENTPFQPDAAGTDGGAPDWRFAGTLGTTIGDHWVGQVTWNHIDSVKLQGALGTNTASTADDQSTIDAFNTFDMFVQYEFRGTGLTQDLSLNLGITNISDEDPPLLKSTNGQTAGFAGTGGNFGRLIQIGLSKHF